LYIIIYQQFDRYSPKSLCTYVIIRYIITIIDYRIVFGYYLWRFFVIYLCADGGGSKPVYPQIFNLASRAVVTANATCGETEKGPEVYCKFGSAGQQCGVCDARSGDPAKTHSPAYAVDNATAGTWWQSPSLHNGDQYQYVTFTIDLKQVRKHLPQIVNKYIWCKMGSTNFRQCDPWLYSAKV